MAREMWVYRTLFGIDLVAAAIVAFFFLWGVSDGTALYAPGLWLLVVSGIAAIIGGGIALARAGRVGLGSALLSLLAIPAVGYGLFILMLLILNLRWN
jgi:hypothetical protein